MSFIIKGSYKTNHPKDVAARKVQELQRKIKGRMCTKSEMWKPTEHNVYKHIKEQKLTLKDALELKKQVKKLNPEDKGFGNTENLRKR